MKIHPVGAELFHSDKRTRRQTGTQTNKQEDIDTVRDVTKLIFGFRNFANAANYLKEEPVVIDDSLGATD